MTLETVDGSLDPVGDGVGQLFGNRPVGIADPNEEVGAFLAGRERDRFLLTVLDVHHLEPDGVSRCHRDAAKGLRSLVVDGNGPKDAVLSQVAEVDLDALGHDERAVGGDAYRDVEPADLDGGGVIP